MNAPPLYEPVKLKLYYATAIFSVIFAVAGFSYNAWRLEVSEDNNTVRTAAFSVLTLLSEMEQNIFSAHYDENPVEGSPRVGWVKVGLIVDLSALISTEVENEAQTLRSLWAEHWEWVPAQERAVQTLTAQIDVVRARIKDELQMLE